MSTNYLTSCLQQTKAIELGKPLNRDGVIGMLQKKIQEIDWESAKADVRPFIADPERLEIWSASFFSSLIEHLQVEVEAV